MIDVRKGFCRISLKSGLILFGEVLEINDEFISFREFDPSATGKSISIKNIVEFNEYDKDEIPSYE